MRLFWLALAAAAIMGSLSLWLLQRPVNLPVAAIAAPSAVADTTTVPPVRVLLGGRLREKLALKIDGPYWVAPLDAPRRILAQGERLPEVSVAATSRGLQIGMQTFDVSRLLIKTHQPATLWVDGRRYRGNLNLHSVASQQFRAVNVVDLEEYLASVLSCEMPPTFPDEARKAQVVAARTYALYHMKTFGHGNDFDLYDSSRSQNYRGVEETDSDQRRLAVETAATRQLVQQTRGVVLQYGGRLFCAYYSAVCGGHTASGESIFGRAWPPLVGVPCDACQDAPNYRWQRDVARTDLEKRLTVYLAQRGRNLGTLQSLRSEPADPGAIPTLELVGTKQRVTLAANVLAAQVLSNTPPSFCFSATLDDDTLRLTGAGWGHGVGLCQHGAAGLARQGLKCGEILRYYYPGCKLGRVQ